MNEDYNLSQTPKASLRAVAIRYGLIVGMIYVIYSLILYITNFHTTNQALSYVSFLFLIGGIYLAHQNFKKENDGFMTYGQGLGIGSLLSAIVGFLSGIFTFIYITFIDTDLMERARELQIAELEKRGMSDEQIEQGMEMAKSFTSPGMMLIWSILGILFFGFLFSLIIAAITKNSPAEFE